MRVPFYYSLVRPLEELGFILEVNFQGGLLQTDFYTKKNEHDGPKSGNHIKSGTKGVGTREEYLKENT